MKRIIFAIVGSIIVFNAWSTVPAGYYNKAYNLAKENLKTALYQIINPHQEVSSYNNLPTYFKQTDVKPGTQEWWDMYSNIPVNINQTFGNYMNREHSLPKSWWGGTTTIPAYVDLYHLYPAEAKANQAKSNYPLGVVTGTVSFDNGVTTVGVGATNGGSTGGKVFEPANEFKGDFARTYFYMVTAYQEMNWVTTWQVRNGTYPSLQTWAIDLLLKWHREDPVSEKEVLRNEAVYKIQNNRNPFIDYPDLAEYIWGNKMGQTWNPSTTTTPENDPVITAPISGMTIDFGEVALGKSTTSQVLVKGNYLTSDIRFNIGGNQASYFSIPGVTQNAAGATAYTVSSTAAGSTSGAWIPVKYTPAEVGEHTSNVVVMGGGVTGSFIVKLKGTCLPVPTLTKPLSPQATDVAGGSYVARWTAPADEVIDYYVVTRNIYKGNNVTTKQDLAETDTLAVDDLADCDYQTFSVHSVRLQCDSPESELVTVRPTAGIDAVDMDAVFTVEIVGGGLVRVRCAEPQSAINVYDIAGRQIRSISGPIYDGYEFTLPAGVYLISTPHHPRPVKAAV